MSSTQEFVRNANSWASSPGLTESEALGVGYSDSCRQALQIGLASQPRDFMQSHRTLLLKEAEFNGSAVIILEFLIIS